MITDKNGHISYTNAFDIALKNDQVKSVGKLIEYIVKYQNNYVSSYLFHSNLGLLIGMNVNVYPLFESKVFIREFDFDAWPGVHYNDEECVRPYNESLFNMRDHYRTVFPESEFAAFEDDRSG